MEQATVATSNPQNTYGPPPASKGYGKVAEYPIHALVSRKAIARVERVENCRGSSPLWPWARSSSSSAERTSWGTTAVTEGSLRADCKSLILVQDEAGTTDSTGGVLESEMEGVRFESTFCLQTRLDFNLFSILQHGLMSNSKSPMQWRPKYIAIANQWNGICEGRSASRIQISGCYPPSRPFSGVASALSGRYLGRL